jgi:uncharacterized protein YecE (DUF72 family)
VATRADAAYVRLHGSPQIYRSIYESARLQQVAAWLRDQRGGALVVFDNTMSGTQARQATQLRALLTARDPASASPP